MMAIATAASAASIVIMKMVKKIPSSLSGYKYLLNTTKLMFTLFKISSIAISIVIILRRVNNTYMPIKNNAVLTKRICDIGKLLIFPKIFLCQVLLLVCRLIFSIAVDLLYHSSQQEPSWRSRYIRP